MEKINNPIIPLEIIIPVLGVFIVLLLINLFRDPSVIKRKLFFTIRLFIVIVLIFCVNLRTMVPHKETKINTKNLDVLFVVDNTLSMWADDGVYGDTRMEDTQEICGDIMDDLEGANFGIVQFANFGMVLSPFTQDSSLVKDALSTMAPPDPYYAVGTSFEEAHDTMEELLASSDKKDDRKTIVFFFSDGESTVDEDDIDAAFSDLADYIDNGAVIGVGTQRGGSMEFEDEYVEDSHGEIAVTKIDEDSLNRIADNLGLDYYYCEEDELIEGKTYDILRIAKDVISDSDLVTYNDTYYIYLYPLLGMLLLEVIIVMRKRTL